MQTQTQKQLPKIHIAKSFKRPVVNIWLKECELEKIPELIEATKKLKITLLRVGVYQQRYDDVEDPYIISVIASYTDGFTTISFRIEHEEPERIAEILSEIEDILGEKWRPAGLRVIEHVSPSKELMMDDELEKYDVLKNLIMRGIMPSHLLYVKSLSYLKLI